MSSMRQHINLYNPVLAPQVQRLSGAVILATWGASLIAAAVIWGGGQLFVAQSADRQAEHARQLAATQAQVGALAARLAGRKPDPALVTQLHEAQAQLAARREALEQVSQISSRPASTVSSYFLALSRQVMSGVWLTGLTIAGTGQDIVLEGRATDAQLLPAYLNQLRREAVLHGHGFASLQVERPRATGAEAQQAFVEFRMASSMQGGPSGASEGKP